MGALYVVTVYVNSINICYVALVLHRRFICTDRLRHDCIARNLYSIPYLRAEHIGDVCIFIYFVFGLMCCI